MANLTHIENVLTGAILYDWGAHPRNDTLNGAWSRRPGTYQVVGGDFGVNPFGAFAAPVATRKLQASFRVLVTPDANRLANLELARDAIVRACTKDALHLLVQNAGGVERVVHAYVTDFADDFQGKENYRHRDFTVTWELNEDWRDRLSRGPHRIADTAGVLMGATPILMGSGSVPLTLSGSAYSPFYITADGTDGLPAPTVDDTAPTFTFTGPLGGPHGFRLICFSLGAQIRDGNGALAATYLDIAQQITTGLATDAITIDAGAMDIRAGGLDIWPLLTVPDWQPWWMKVCAGEVNTYQVVPLPLGTFSGIVDTTTRVATAWLGLYR